MPAVVEARRRGRGAPRKTGEGRPSYWAAPMTTMASAGLRVVTFALRQIRHVAYGQRRGPCPGCPTAASRPMSRLSDRGTSCTWRPIRTSTDRCARSGRRPACTRAARHRPAAPLRPRRRPAATGRIAERLADVAGDRSRQGPGDDRGRRGRRRPVPSLAAYGRSSGRHRPGHPDRRACRGRARSSAADPVRASAADPRRAVARG